MMNLKNFFTLKLNKRMKKLLTKLEKWYDIYFVWVLYNGKKQQRYYKYLKNKWGDEL